MPQNFRHLFGILILGATVLAPHIAWGSAVAAHIDGFSADSRDFAIQRDEHTIAPRFNLPLQNGDTISALDKGATLRLRYVDGRSVSVTSANSPYHVTTTLTVANSEDNFLETLWEDVTKSHDAGLHSTNTRGGPEPLRLAIPGLADGSAIVSAGNRHFMLQWVGGAAPFHVVLRGNHNRILVDESNIQKRRIAVASRATALTQGQYSIEIRDATGAPARGTFSVYETGSSQQTGVASSPDVDNVVEFMRAHPGPATAYDSYLRLFDGIAANDPRSVGLADYIAQGETPSL